MTSLDGRVFWVKDKMCHDHNDRTDDKLTIFFPVSRCLLSLVFCFFVILSFYLKVRGFNAPGGLCCFWGSRKDPQNRRWSCRRRRVTRSIVMIHILFPMSGFWTRQVSNINLDTKTKAEQPPNHIKQPTGDPEHQPLKMRKMRKFVKWMIDPKFI